jgi:hypothetical protein
MPTILLLHILSGAALIAVAGTVAVWGGARSKTARLGGAGTENRLLTQFAALVQTLVIATGIAGLILLLGDDRPSDRLHATVYGPFMLLFVIGTYSYRTDDPVRNLRIVAIASLFIALLGVRAFVTG